MMTVFNEQKSVYLGTCLHVTVSRHLRRHAVPVRSVFPGSGHQGMRMQLYTPELLPSLMHPVVTGVPTDGASLGCRQNPGISPNLPQPPTDQRDEMNFTPNAPQSPQRGQSRGTRDCHAWEARPTPHHAGVLLLLSFPSPARTTASKSK